MAGHNEVAYDGEPDDEADEDAIDKSAEFSNGGLYGPGFLG